VCKRRGLSLLAIALVLSSCGGRDASIRPKFGLDAANVVREADDSDGRHCVHVEVAGTTLPGKECGLDQNAKKFGVEILYASANYQDAPQFVVGFAADDVELELRFNDAVYPIEWKKSDGFFAVLFNSSGQLQRLTARRGNRVLSVCERSSPGIEVSLDCISQG
jgi:hypothetical protein